MLKDTSPFTPGSPVGIDLFAGRVQQIEDVGRYLRQAASGRQENVFLIGDRGIGKSSFASVVSEIAARRYEMVGAYVSLGGVSTVEELTRRVIEGLVEAGRGEPWYQRLFHLLKGHVREVGALSLKVSFQPPHSNLTALAGTFPETLSDLIANVIEDNRKGLIIVLDDINGLAETPTFARWYKSVVDKIAVTRFGDFPALMMLSGVPERRDQLARHEPSLMRVFRLVELDRLSDDEVHGFFTDAFGLVDMPVSDDAMETMIHFASGLPVMMQEIGDATFLADTDGKISATDAHQGVIDAAYRVGRKYMEPSVFRALHSPRYQAIVRKMGETMEATFTRQEILSRLTPEESRVFDNLRRRLSELGVIERDQDMGPGAYRYTNQLYPVYMYMQAQL